MKKHSVSRSGLSHFRVLMAGALVSVSALFAFLAFATITPPDGAGGEPLSIPETIPFGNLPHFGVGKEYPVMKKWPASSSGVCHLRNTMAGPFLLNASGRFPDSVSDTFNKGGLL